MCLDFGVENENTFRVAAVLRSTHAGRLWYLNTQIAMAVFALTSPSDGNVGRERRVLSAVLAGVGCALSIYLTLYQYEVIDHVWDPFFGGESRVVLHAGQLDAVSRLVGFPLHDALIGVLAYGLETMLAIAGSKNRLAGPRWLDRAYCSLVVAMALTSLGLVVTQAAVFQAWCTLCLASAAISFVMVLLNWGQIAGFGQWLARRTRAVPRKGG